MKWVSGIVALLAVVSGCVSLNRGSDQVAQLAPVKDGAKKASLFSSPAEEPAETVALGTGDRPQADATVEVKGTSPFPVPDLLDERTPTRVVRASPPETPRPPTPAPNHEPPPAVVETKSTEPPVAAPPSAGAASPSEVKLPTMINGAAAMAPIAPTPAVVEPAIPRPSAAAVRMVNSKRISLNYEIKDIGPSGVSAVELWYTQDGKKWEKSDTISKPRPPFVVDLKDEGLYGFTLIARSGAGLGKRPPAPGEQPQIWVEVDVTKPVVKLLDLQPSINGESQHLNISWKAADANLSPRPITLLYAEQAAGPWSTIASNLENTGVYSWQLPPGTPSRFLVRVEAADLVGNVGIAQTPEPMILDLSQPTVSIVAVEPAAK